MKARLWLHGLIGAVVGGGANAITLIVVDPNTFNIYQGWRSLLSATIVSGIVSGSFYLKKSPIPENVLTIKPESPSIKNVLLPIVIASGLVLAACSSHYNSLPAEASTDDKAKALALDAKDWLANPDNQRTIHDGLVITGKLLIQKAVSDADRDDIKNQLFSISNAFNSLATGQMVTAGQVDGVVKSFTSSDPSKYSAYTDEANLVWQLIYSKLNLANDPNLIKQWLILLADAAQQAAK